jgi:imidazolonepropionase-like amidohydrolase
MQADLIAIDGNPLENIAAVANVVFDFAVTVDPRHE